MAKELQFDMPKADGSIITVIGVGGGGGNAVNNMYKEGIKGVDFIVANTDAQALELSKVPLKIQLGGNMTEGRGAGSDPEIGRKAALENIDQIKNAIEQNTKMLFVTAGMGGGTGTGAAPVIAETARQMGILTVGIITTPFLFEGRHRRQKAIQGIKSLKEKVDTLVIINNETLKELYRDLAISKAFAYADNVLTTAARGIAEIITVAGYVNVDFEDVRTVMRDSGVAIMGSATCSGEDRARKAIEEAIDSPILNYKDIRGAQYILLNISSGNEDDVSMDELDIITEYLQQESGMNADLIWGHCQDESLNDKLNVTLIATGFESDTNEFEDMGKADGPQDAHRAGQSPRPEQNKANSPRPSASSEPTSPSRQRRRLNHQKTAPEAKKNQPRQQAPTHSTKARNQDEANAAPKMRKSYQPVRFESQNLEQMENKPAFERRNVSLNYVPNAANEQISRYTLSIDAKGDDTQLRSNNRYLHDNVD